MVHRSPRAKLLTRSATQLAAQLCAREVTSREVVEAHIQHIERVNPRINAVVADRFAEARAEAEAADVALASEDRALPPFHGVPCTIKECFQLTGMPNTAGLVARRGVISTEDGVTVARMRSAGFIPLGVTNLSELCMWMESTNRVYGRSRNPYDPRRIVGGSSGGEGAIIGAGGSPVGLGSDIGGSIRMPAFFNGVFGHKPSSGLVPSSGQFPVSHTEVGLRLLGTGPLARRAEDLMPLLRILAGPDGADSTTQVRTLGDPGAVEMGELEVFSVEGNGFRRVSPTLIAAQREATAVLQGQGARVRTVELPVLRRSLDLWSQMMNVGTDTPFRTMLGNGAPLPLSAFLKFAIGRSEHTFAALMLAATEGIPLFNTADVVELTAQVDAVRDEVHDLLGDRGVMLFPSYTRPAPRHGLPLLTPLDWVYTAVFNVLQLPVTQVPLGLSKRRAPLGVQVVAPHGEDHRSIGVAMALERGFGGWVPPWVVR